MLKADTPLFKILKKTDNDGISQVEQQVIAMQLSLAFACAALVLGLSHVTGLRGEQATPTDALHVIEVSYLPSMGQIA